ncbi:MAG: ABC-F family ATP-binding cassette domain-containing protein [Candidatus Onthomorpha sp.]|nr:ABC-F family ATP-binding cassette domain-containing protein [Bacteroidales bacterium]MCI7035370.1 ABC-F family ATP-binding cassette domain-containing protein [Bacteroidales bacterium]MCI7562875.1 ABC-F family ATP-binding cassette domain-containing protein [Bacteroidales bacterium]MDY4861102.1 ABC-F family ATP-binding cassette domain-containing protein [Candidatus Onthomorpha sp.]
MAENYITVENLSKSYGEKPLFENIGFGINKGQKTALVAANGSGKSTLLKILAGKEPYDDGKLSFRKNISVAYLEQQPLQGVQASIMDVIFESDSPLMKTVKRYEQAVRAVQRDPSPKVQQELTNAISEMDSISAWNYESEVKEILGKLQIDDLEQSVATLSGGERKKVALCMVLLSNSEVLLLDEPTNHLDIQMIEWLENYLSKANQSLLVVSHDRYFIDAISTDIYELDNCTINKYHGNFAYYLEKKAERQQQQAAWQAKARNLYKKELEWIRRMPQARGTKSRSRIEAFEQLEQQLQQKVEQESKTFSVKSRRIGSKILEINNITKTYDDRVIIDDFSHTYKRGDKIGIVGSNGCGKTTFLEVITGKAKADRGKVTIGQTITIGYFTQNTPTEKPDTRVIDIIRRSTDSITLADGTHLSASQYLTYFGIPPQKQFTEYSLLSGGERRLLFLLEILITNPNFLILDEPTNDLDIYTQMKLENFLEDYDGCLLVVSHDRHFLDRICSQLFVFEQNGKIKEYPFSYTSYLEDKKSKQKAESQAKRSTEKTFAENKKPQREHSKRKLSYKEQRELEEIEKSLPDLEQQKAALEQQMNSGELTTEQLTEKSLLYQQILEQIDQKELRWLELNEPTA